MEQRFITISFSHLLLQLSNNETRGKERKKLVAFVFVIMFVKTIAMIFIRCACLCVSNNKRIEHRIRLHPSIVRAIIDLTTVVVDRNVNTTKYACQ